MFLQFFSRFRDFGFRHFREREIMLPDIGHAEIIYLGHGEAFCGANRGA